MADRSVDVRLGLDVTQYTSNAEKAAASTKQVTAEINKQGGAATTALKQTEASAVRVAAGVAQGAAAAGPALAQGVEKAAASASTAATVAGSRLGKNLASGLGQAVRGSLSGTAGDIAQATSGLGGAGAVSGLGAIAGALAPVVGILGAGALAWKLWSNNAAEAAAREKAFADALKADQGLFGTHTRALIDSTFAAAGLNSNLVSTAVAQKGVVGSAGDLAAAQRTLTANTNEGAAATVGGGRAATSMAAEQLKLHGTLDTTAEAFHRQQAAIAGTIPVAAAYNSTIQRTLVDEINVDNAIIDTTLAQYDAADAHRAALQAVANLNKANGASPKLIRDAEATVIRLGKAHKSSALEIRSAVEQITAVGNASGASKAQIADAVAVIRDLGRKGVATDAQLAHATATVAALGSAHKLTAQQSEDAYRGIVASAKLAAAAVSGAEAKDVAMRSELELLRGTVADGSPLAKALDQLIAKLAKAFQDRHATLTLNQVNIAQNLGESHGGADRAAARRVNIFAPQHPGITTDPTIHHAAGGPVYGRGTSTSDSVAAALSTGEFVERAASVTKYGQGIFRALNNGTYQGGLQLTPKAIAGLEKIAASGLRPDNWNISGNDPASIAREVKAIRDMDRMLYGVS